MAANKHLDECSSSSWMYFGGQADKSPIYAIFIHSSTMPSNDTYLVVGLSNWTIVLGLQ